MKRDQSLSPLVIILLILITFPLDNVWRLLIGHSLDINQIVKRPWFYCF